MMYYIKNKGKERKLIKNLGGSTLWIQVKAYKTPKAAYIVSGKLAETITPCGKIDITENRR